MVRFVLSGFFCLVCVRGPNKKCTAKQSIAGQDRNRYTGDFQPILFSLAWVPITKHVFDFFVLFCSFSSLYRVSETETKREYTKNVTMSVRCLVQLARIRKQLSRLCSASRRRAKQIITLVDCMPYNIHPWLCRRYSIESHLLCKVWAWAWWVRHIENGAMNCSYPIVIMNNNISNWNCLR